MRTQVEVLTTKIFYYLCLLILVPLTQSSSGIRVGDNLWYVRVKSKVSKKKSLSKIKSSAVSRGFSLAKMSMNAGAQAAAHSLGGFFRSETEQGESARALLMSQLQVVSRELGQLKGSVMKVGQMLSMSGEHLLPPEANALLKSLQSQSAPLEWREIERVLMRELGAAKLALLEIEPEPIASASLGQVHRARLKSDGRQIALKVQYPGVKNAIEADLKVLRSVLSLTKLIPKGPKYDAVFEEVRQMLHRETDYELELKTTREFRELLKPYPNYIVAEPIDEFSTGKVLATTHESGLPVDSPEVLALPQEQRNAIGRAALELSFLELFRFHMMQTDAHFGNFRIRPDTGQLVLFDFGAVKSFEPEFLKHYFRLAKGAFYRNRDWILSGAEGLNFIRSDDSDELRNTFCQMTLMISEPFEGEYDWGASNLPKRAALEGSKLALAFKLRSPPKDLIFLDRKLAGIFVLVSALKVKTDSRSLLESYLKNI